MASKSVKQKKLGKSTSITKLDLRVFNPNYTFDQFVSGHFNHIALSAAKSVARSPATAFNPLFICGEEGLGKSHLLNAIGNSIVANLPRLNICYCSAYEFAHSLCNQHHLKNMAAFRNYFCSVDVLLFDDIQFISGTYEIQQEFFRIFNVLFEANKQIVITSCMSPCEIHESGEHIRYNLELGACVELQPPNLENKIAILKKKMELTGIWLPDNVLSFLASIDTRNIRELEGILIKLGAYSNLQNTPIDLEMAKSIQLEMHGATPQKLRLSNIHIESRLIS